MESNFYNVTDGDLRLTQEEIWEDISNGMAEAEDITRRQAIEMLFKKNHYQDDFLELPWYLKAFYWVKTFLCLGFGLTNGVTFNPSICMVCWNDRRIGELVSWDCCWVETETGIFRNWRVHVGTDGN